jgi:hypothetical protein
MRLRRRRWRAAGALHEDFAGSLSSVAESAAICYFKNLNVWKIHE